MMKVPGKPVSDARQVSLSLWDPLAAWPAGRWWLWGGLAVLTVLLQGPGFIQSLRPDPQEGVDFFQEWSSARSFFQGGSLYENIPDLAEQFLGVQVDRTRAHISVNAHPPTAILLLMPLAVWEYPTACLVWNLVSLIAFAGSLWCVMHALKIPWVTPAVLPLVSLLLLCNPLRQQVNQGQLGGVLALLLTGVWLLDRAGRPRWAGTLLGLATAIKLFPAFIFLYFIVRREWRTLAAGCLALAAVTAVTATVIGFHAYDTYFRDVVPHVAQYRAVWANASLAGYMAKLFDPAPPEHCQHWQLLPLWNSPKLALCCWALSSALVLSLVIPAIWRSRSRAESDRAFGVTVTAMLLLSPVTWDHYFLVLIMPLAAVWQWLPASGFWRPLFLTTVAGLWLSPGELARLIIPKGDPIGIVDATYALTLFSFPSYALLGFLALGVSAARQPKQEYEACVRTEQFSATPESPQTL